MTKAIETRTYLTKSKAGHWVATVKTGIKVLFKSDKRSTKEAALAEANNFRTLLD